MKNYICDLCGGEIGENLECEQCMAVQNFYQLQKENIAMCPPPAVSNSVILTQLNNINKNLQQILENTKKKQPANLDTLIFDGGSIKCKMISADQLEDVLEEVVVFCYGVNPEKWDFKVNGEPDFIIYKDNEDES